MKYEDEEKREYETKREREARLQNTLFVNLAFNEFLVSKEGRIYMEFICIFLLMGALGMHVIDPFLYLTIFNNYKPLQLLLYCTDGGLKEPPPLKMEVPQNDMLDEEMAAEMQGMLNSQAELMLDAKDALNQADLLSLSVLINAFHVILNMLKLVTVTRMMITETKFKGSVRANQVLGYLNALSTLGIIFLLIYNYSFAQQFTQAAKCLQNHLPNRLYSYYTNVEMGAQIDRMQTLFDCCGSDGLQDWFKVNLIANKGSVRWAYSKVPGKEHLNGQTLPKLDYVPYSCCRPEIMYPCTVFDPLNKQGLYINSSSHNPFKVRGCRFLVYDYLENISYRTEWFVMVWVWLEIATNILQRMINCAYFTAYKFGYDPSLTEVPYLAMIFYAFLLCIGFLFVFQKTNLFNTILN